MKLTKDLLDGVLDEGGNYDMSKICSCHSDMNTCERNCPKYYRCDSIALADDILKEYEDSEFFELTKEHVELLTHLNIGVYFDLDSENGAYPDIDIKRLFGNGSCLSDVAEILQMKPERSYSEEELYEGKDATEGFLFGYSPEQIMKCRLYIVELIPALAIVLKEQSFEPGLYAINRYGAYYHYQHARNYTLLYPFIKEIEREFFMGPTQLHIYAANISGIDDTSVYEKFLKSLSMGYEDNMRMKDIEWLNYAFDELHKKIDSMQIQTKDAAADLTDASLLEMLNKAELDEIVVSDVYNSITHYFMVPKEVLNYLPSYDFPEAVSAEISIELPNGFGDVSEAQVMVSPTNEEGEDYDWHSFFLSSERVEALIRLAKESKK